MRIEATSVDDYIAKLPEPRAEAVSKLRRVILQNLPDGFAETMGYGMPAYVVPHEVYPDGYHCDPKLALQWSTSMCVTQKPVLPLVTPNSMLKSSSTSKHLASIWYSI